MSIEKSFVGISLREYKTTREVLGICPKGTKVRPATNKEGKLQQGTSGETYLFSLPNGGGVYLKESEVEPS